MYKLSHTCHIQYDFCNRCGRQSLCPVHGCTCKYFTLGELITLRGLANLPAASRTQIAQAHITQWGVEPARIRKFANVRYFIPAVKPFPQGA